MGPTDRRAHAVPDRNARDRPHEAVDARQTGPGESRDGGAEPGERSAILVLGMHRSLTSAITGSLAHAGAAVPVNLLPADRNNP